MTQKKRGAICKYKTNTYIDRFTKGLGDLYNAIYSGIGVNKKHQIWRIRVDKDKFTVLEKAL